MIRALSSGDVSLHQTGTEDSLSDLSCRASANTSELSYNTHTHTRTRARARTQKEPGPLTPTLPQTSQILVWGLRVFGS